MSESKSSVKLRRLLLMLSDSDMAAAAQQLMQLSDEDNKSSSSSGSNSNGDINKKVKAKIKSKRFFEQSQDEITSAKIEEIFGKEEEILRPIKKQKYRFLDSVYEDTKPLKVSYGKNLWH